jgi:hypothetical protein
VANEAGLLVVNEMKSQLTSMARNVVTALADERLSALEIFSLATRALLLGQTLTTLVQSKDRQTAREILHVLEHGQFTLPPEPQAEVPRAAA